MDPKGVLKTVLLLLLFLFFDDVSYLLLLLDTEKFVDPPIPVPLSVGEPVCISP